MCTGTAFLPNTFLSNSEFFIDIDVHLLQNKAPLLSESLATLCLACFSLNSNYSKWLAFVSWPLITNFNKSACGPHAAFSSIWHKSFEVIQWAATIRYSIKEICPWLFTKHHAMQTYEGQSGGRPVAPHTFLTSALQGGEWSSSRPDHFTIWYSFGSEVVGLQSQSLRCGEETIQSCRESNPGSGPVTILTDAYL
jgi:hypothetical protein